MTTLYRPVLIESAEQAEALPRGTVATSGHHESFGPFAAIRTGDVPDWYMTTAPDTWADNAEVVGWTALVPIEAEEETTVVTRPAGIIDADKYPYADAHFDSDGNVWFGDAWDNVVDVTAEYVEWATKNKRTRLVTPWEAS